MFEFRQRSENCGKTTFNNQLGAIEENAFDQIPAREGGSANLVRFHRNSKERVVVG